MAATHLSSPFGHRTRHVHKLAASRLAGEACHGRAAKGDKLHLSSCLSTNACVIGHRGGVVLKSTGAFLRFIVVVGGGDFLLLKIM